MANIANDEQVVELKFDKKNVKKLVAMLAILIVICSVVTVSVIMYAPRSEGYNVMYLLDVQSQMGASFPQDFVVKQNGSFDVQVVVVNNKPVLGDYQVQVKVVEDTFSFPVNADACKVYDFMLDSKQSWDDKVSIVLDEKGSFSVVFELFSEKEGVYRFTGIYCVIHVNVV
jgi:uncharacterized membrane protein